MDSHASHLAMPKVWTQNSIVATWKRSSEENSASTARQVGFPAAPRCRLRNSSAQARSSGSAYPLRRTTSRGQAGRRPSASLLRRSAAAARSEGARQAMVALQSPSSVRYQTSSWCSALQWLLACKGAMKWAAVGPATSKSRARSKASSAFTSSSFEKAPSIMCTRSCASGGWISSYLQATSSAATPTSCNLDLLTGALER
mmetsp:Transcript_75968/g.163004  ORF Transcript_75968/g.163004 Transcript_75968/m.163004 type:complete len:201 (+) Transcript_75968:57-659(+)